MPKRLTVAMVVLVLMPVLARAQDRPVLPPGVAHVWAGSLRVHGTRLPLVFHIAPGPGGGYQATMDSPAQNAFAVKVDEVQVQGRKVTLLLKHISGRFDGVLAPDGKALTGRWTQNGVTLPLNLLPAAGPSVGRRPQDPVPPFPYDVDAVTFLNAHDDVRLAGTLTRPRGPGPFPAVLLIGGSGAVNRDESVFGHRPFRVLADGLTRRGLVVLRYDKRGIGASGGGYATATTRDLARDAASGLDYLRARADVDPRCVGLLGHSEGGDVAPMVAQMRPHAVAFVVLLAGTAVPGRDLLLAQHDRLMAAEGSSRAAIARSRKVDERIYAIVMANPSDAVARRKLHAVLRQAYASLPASERGHQGGEHAWIAGLTRAVMSPWIRFFLAYDPQPALRRLRCPVLALFGSRDLQVPPGQNLAPMRAALAGDRDATVRELEGLNHLFQHARTGDVSEYATIAETMSPQVLQMVGDWIVQQVRGR